MVADAYRERESHDRSSIDLPPVQKQLAAEVIALGKPTVSCIQTSSVCTAISATFFLLLSAGDLPAERRLGCRGDSDQAPERRGHRGVLPVSRHDIPGIWVAFF